MRKVLRTSKWGLVALVVGLLAWTGCDATGVTAPEDEDDPGATEGAQVRLYLTDAPADLAEAYVTVQRVDAVPEEGAPFTLMDRDTTLNLLELQNGVTATLADTTLPEGSYSQLRFIVADTASVLLTDGSEMDLKVPSGTETGIKINLPELEVTPDLDLVEITLDFRVDDSFVRAGNSGKYIFKPVVRTQSVELDGDDAGVVNLSGAVSAVDAANNTVAVDSVGFAITQNTEFEETLALADLAAGDFVVVEGARQSDGTLAAQEIGLQPDEGTDRLVEANVEAVTDSTVTTVGIDFQVTSATTFDGITGPSDLQVGDSVEIAYELSGGEYVAVAVER